MGNSAQCEERATKYSPEYKRNEIEMELSDAKHADKSSDSNNFMSCSVLSY